MELVFKPTTQIICKNYDIFNYGDDRFVIMAFDIDFKRLATALLDSCKQQDLNVIVDIIQSSAKLNPTRSTTNDETKEQTNAIK